MARGRKPTPTHLRLVSGNPGRRPINKSEPKPLRTLPSPPAHVSDKAREIWGRLSVILDDMGVLTTADTLALEVLAEAYADWLGARDALEEFGSRYYETVNQTGGVMHRAHPAVAVMQDADKRIKAWLSEFGLTPSARSRVSGNGEKDTSSAEEKYFGADSA